VARTMTRRKFLIRSAELDFFDVERDPAEKNNLFNEQPDNIQKLKMLLQNWEQQVKHKR
jgi:hypothetical protein